MEFGVFVMAQQRSCHQTSRQVINNAVEQTVTAEAAGFDTAWYAEHHFNNYSLPPPLMMVAHCAGLTGERRRHRGDRRWRGATRVDGQLRRLAVHGSTPACWSAST